MSNRIWSIAVGDYRAAPTFPYIFDPGLVNTGTNIPITGNWRPFTVDDSLGVLASGMTNTSTPSGAAPFTGYAPLVTGQILAANVNRMMFYIQNISPVSALYVNLGTGLVSTGSFSLILNPAPATGQGGQSFTNNYYRGAVWVSGAAAIAWEI